MNQLQIFSYSDKQVRTLLKDGEPWWVLKDVADILGIQNHKDVAARLDTDEKGVDLIDTPGGTQKTTIINEPGLYNVILRSDKPEAKAFKRWITHEVLPAIRKTGGYSMVPKTFAEALRLAADLEEQRQKLLPKAENYDWFLSGEGLQDMNTVAKVLGWGRNKLFAYLRDKKILMANNNPYQEYIDRGYFEVKEKPIKMGDAVFNKHQTFVTAKGFDYISKLVKAGVTNEKASYQRVLENAPCKLR